MQGMTIFTGTIPRACALCADETTEGVYMAEETLICHKCLSRAMDMLRGHVARTLPESLSSGFKKHASKSDQILKWRRHDSVAHAVAIECGYQVEEDDSAPWFKIEAKHESYDYPQGIRLTLRNGEKPTRLLTALRSKGMHRDAEPVKDSGEATIRWSFGFPDDAQNWLHVVWHTGEAKEVCRYVVTGYKQVPVRELVCPGDPRYSAPEPVPEVSCG